MDVLPATMNEQPAVWATAVSVVLLVLALWAKRRLSGSSAVHRSFAELSGPPGLPVVGNAWELVRNGVKNFGKTMGGWAEKYGDKFRINFLGGDILVISDVSGIRGVMSRYPHTFFRDEELCKVTAGAGFDGVFAANGDVWTRQRRLTSPALSEANVNMVLDKIAFVAGRLLSKWDGYAATSEPFDCCDDCSRYAVNVASVVVCDTDLDCFGTSSAIEFEDVRTLIRSVGDRMCNPLPLWKLLGDRKHDQATRRVDAMIMRILGRSQKEQAAKAAAGAKAGCLMECLLGANRAAADKKDRNYLSDAEVVGNVKTFLLAGADTVSAGIAWVLWYLATNRKDQELAQQEVDALQAAGALEQGALPSSPEVLARMTYIEAIVTEAFRLRPPAGAIFGLTAQTDVEVMGIQVPKGTSVMCHTRNCLASSEFFTEPDRFWPSRWRIAAEDPAYVAQRPETFVHDPRPCIPFGFGPRICPGRSLAIAQIKILLYGILGRFDVSLKAGHQEPAEEQFIGLSPSMLELQLHRRLA